MKCINGYWIDERNNRWSSSLYTKAEAIKVSNSCHNCYDCNSCNNCHNCNNCHDCRNCHGCHGCHDCNSCYDCNNCRNYKTNPNRYAQKELGSNWPNTCIYWDKEQTNIQVICGCFSGTLETFHNAVLAKYSETHPYIKFIRITEKILQLEKESL